jgi:hypothetical protein
MSEPRTAPGEPAKANAVDRAGSEWDGALSQSRDRPSLRAVVAALGWIAVCVGIQLTRQAGPPATDTIWAEDGHLFLTAALNFDHPFELFLAPAGKYLHAAPRMIAWLVAGRPLSEAAWLFATLSALAVAGLSLFVFVVSKPLLPDVGPRAFLAAMMVLLAPANVESLNNAANLHYFLGFAAFWALLSQPRSWAASVVAAGVVAVAALSDPVTVVMTPLAILLLIRRWGARRALVGGVFLLSLAIHGAVWLNADRPGRYADPGIPVSVQDQLELRSFAPQSYAESRPSDLPALYGLRVVGSVWGGNDLLAAAWRSIGAAVAYAGLIVVAVIVLAGAFRRRLQARWRLGLFLGYSISFFVVPVAIRGTQHLEPHPDGLSLAGSRFVLIPALLLLAAISVWAETSPGSPRPGWARFLRTGAAVAILAVALLDLRDPNLRSLGPRWSMELSAATERCRSGDGYVEVPITPPEGFNVLVRCSRVLTDAASGDEGEAALSAGRRALKIISERPTYRQSSTSNPSDSNSERSPS